MYDSSAKYPGGILTGYVNELGNYDQCMSVTSKQLRIDGAYALVNIRFGPSDNEKQVQDDPIIVHWNRSKVMMRNNNTNKSYGLLNQVLLNYKLNNINMWLFYVLLLQYPKYLTTGMSPKKQVQFSRNSRIFKYDLLFNVINFTWI